MTLMKVWMRTITYLSGRWLSSSLASKWLTVTRKEFLSIYLKAYEAVKYRSSCCQQGKYKHEGEDSCAERYLKQAFGPSLKRLEILEWLRLPWEIRDRYGARLKQARMPWLGPVRSNVVHQ